MAEKKEEAGLKIEERIPEAKQETTGLKWRAGITFFSFKHSL